MFVIRYKSDGKFDQNHGWPVSFLEADRYETREDAEKEAWTLDDAEVVSELEVFESTPNTPLTANAASQMQGQIVSVVGGSAIQYTCADCQKDVSYQNMVMSDYGTIRCRECMTDKQARHAANLFIDILEKDASIRDRLRRILGGNNVG